MISPRKTVKTIGRMMVKRAASLSRRFCSSSLAAYAATPGSRVPPPEEEGGEREEDQGEPKSRHHRQGDAHPTSRRTSASFQPSMQPPERAEVADDRVGAADVGRAGEVAADEAEEDEDARRLPAPACAGVLANETVSSPSEAATRAPAMTSAITGPIAPQWAAEEQPAGRPAGSRSARAPPGTRRCTCPPGSRSRGVGVVNRRGSVPRDVRRGCCGPGWRRRRA